MSKNDITGDSIVTKQYSESYGNGYERIFGITCKRCGKRGLQQDGVHTCSPQIKDERKPIKTQEQMNKWLNVALKDKP